MSRPTLEIYMLWCENVCWKSISTRDKVNLQYIDECSFVRLSKG